MAVTKKIIGRIPICFGTWYAKQGGWGIKNRVTLYGSEFESLHENNTVPPAVYDEIENTVSFNENDWRVISNGTEAWLADAKIDALGTWEENPEFVEVCLDKNGRILYGVQRNGNFLFGAGVPQQIVDFVKSYTGNIEKFLAGFDGDETLKEYLEENYGKYEENLEFVEVKLDSTGHILWGIKEDGDIVFGCGIPSEIQRALNKITKDINDSFGDIRNAFHYVTSPEYLFACLDREGKFLYGVTVEGKFRAADLDFELPEEEAKWLNTIFSLIEDPENRLEVTLDGEDKLIGWRDKEGVKHETDMKVEHSLSLSDEAMTDFQQALKDAGFQPGGGGDFSDREVIELPEPKGCALVNLIVDKLPLNDGEVSEGFVEYYDKLGNYFKLSCSIEPQGQTSKEFAKTGGKGNYTLDVSNDVKFGSWVPQDSFHLKGAAKDVTRGILPTSYKWAYLMQEYLNSRPNRVLVDESGITTTAATGNRMNDWPIEARCLPDGFPFELYVNGEYWGLYAWQLKKHRKNYSMNKNDYTSLFLDADKMMSHNYQHGIWNDGPDAADPDHDFAKWWNGMDIKGPSKLLCMDGSEFDGDHPKELMDSTSPYWDSADKKKREGSAQAKAIIRGFSTKYLEVNTLIENEDINGAKAKFEENFDKDACILVYIFNCLMKNEDSIKKNTLWGTYADGKIFPMLWDLDGMYGTGWTGTKASAPSAYLWTGAYATAAWPLALLWTLYSDEIKESYAALRTNEIISMNTWHDIVFNQWVNRIGEDAYNRDIKRWPETPSYRENYTNTEYWTVVTEQLGLGNYNVWNENTSYSVNSFAALSMHPKTGRYTIYKALKASDSSNPQCPVTQFYTMFPMEGGFYDSPKRWEKWIQEQIRVCDIIMDYNQ